MKRWAPPTANNPKPVPMPVVEWPLPTRKSSKDANDAKLIFGTIFSLRRMARQHGRADDQFLSYRTNNLSLQRRSALTTCRDG